MILRIIIIGRHHHQVCRFRKDGRKTERTLGFGNVIIIVVVIILLLLLFIIIIIAAGGRIIRTVIVVVVLAILLVVIIIFRIIRQGRKKGRIFGWSK